MKRYGRTYKSGQAGSVTVIIPKPISEKADIPADCEIVVECIKKGEVVIHRAANEE